MIRDVEIRGYRTGQDRPGTGTGTGKGTGTGQEESGPRLSLQTHVIRKHAYTIQTTPNFIRRDSQKESYIC